MKKIFLKYYPLTILILILSACTQTSDLKKRGKYGIAKIYEIDYIPRGNFHFIKYKYIVNDSLYKSSSSFFYINENFERMLLDSTFPVIYLPEKPTISRILVKEYDFKTLDLIYPDSLSWVEENR
jgi:hypothetical protein